MLPICCVKMSARSCSSSAAVCPAAIAFSNRSRAGHELVAAHRTVGRQRHAVGSVEDVLVMIHERLLEHEASETAGGVTGQARVDEREHPAVARDALGAGTGALGGGGEQGGGHAREHRR